MQFKERLQNLGFQSYSGYLAGQHWQDFKHAYRVSTRPQLCAVCASPSIELHHHTYERLGAEWLKDVIPLCRDHHEAVHVWLREKSLPVEATKRAVMSIRDRAANAQKAKKKKAVPRIDQVAAQREKEAKQLAELRSANASFRANLKTVPRAQLKPRSSPSERTDFRNLPSQPPTPDCANNSRSPRAPRNQRPRRKCHANLSHASTSSN